MLPTLMKPMFLLMTTPQSTLPELLMPSAHTECLLKHLKRTRRWAYRKTWKMADGSEIQVRMWDGTFSDGTPQALYFPVGHPKAGLFKGMRTLIKEQIAKGANLPNPDNLKAECKKFKCPPG
jgi:hypothetical protein